MAKKPIFVATHPRACSTAFERVFMTRRDTLKCVHEPFGDAFYYGPERLSRRYEADEKARVASGFSNSTYKTILDRIDREASEGPRPFVKDMVYYLFPEDGKPASIVPSLQQAKQGVSTDNVNGTQPNNGIQANGAHYTGTVNPTVVPVELLSKFHFVFLIRDPHYSIPSFYRCTVPPLDKLTGFYEFYESEAGYEELRRFFDFLREIKMIGPHCASGRNATNDANGASSTNGYHATNGSKVHEPVEICVVDADDLLDDPTGVIERFCQSVGEEYTPNMLNWDNEEDQATAKEAFEKWPGFHEDAMQSKSLKPRAHRKQPKSEEEFDHEWREKYGDKGARIIRLAVDRSMPDYLYLKQYAMKA